VDQERHAEPDRRVQRSCGVRGADRRPSPGIRHRRLRVDGQSGPVGGRPCRRQRHAGDRAGPGRPGTYDDVNRLCGELADAYGWAFVNVNVRPFYAEGSKTIGFEIAEQLGWRLPDQVVAPMASGAMLVKIEKAFRELIELELVDDRACRVSGAQASGCSPITTAYANGGDSILPVRPDTIAKSLAIGDPADGYYALEAVDRSGGVMDDASDPEIIHGIKLLARTEGIFGETAAGVTIAVLRKLAAQGHLAPGDRTVAVVSGTGLKTTDAVAPTLGPTFEITPSLDEFQSALSLQESA
jgi:threonine synthase